MARRAITRCRVVVALSLYVGAMVWIASPYFTGKAEAWDASTNYYVGTLVTGGFVAGILEPQRYCLTAGAMWIGQSLGFIWMASHTAEHGPFMFLAFSLFLPLYSALSLLGSWLGSRLRLRVSKPRQ